MPVTEPFSDWLEEKIDLPIFEELPSPECGQNKPTIYQSIPKIQTSHHNNNHHLLYHQQHDTTQSLLQEFESVLGGVEACHQIIVPPNINANTLTPPQTPPPISKARNIVDTQLLVTLQPLQPATLNYASQLEAYQTSSTPLNKIGQLNPQQAVAEEQWSAENISLAPLGDGDVASELAAVDEYVRSCAEDIAPSSPCLSSTSGVSSSSEESIDDPDWSLTGPSTSHHANGSLKRASAQRNRYKPYRRPNVEDKKVRKKEQNKNAATRYRQKKKQEIKEIVGEEQELADHNAKLKDKVHDLQREIGYLKGLMRDLFKAKGLLK